jgi:hypothetical protein
MTKTERSGQIRAWADEWHGDFVKLVARRTSCAADAQGPAQEVCLRLLRIDRLNRIDRTCSP